METIRLGQFGLTRGQTAPVVARLGTGPGGEELVEVARSYGRAWAVVVDGTAVAVGQSPAAAEAALAARHADPGAGWTHARGGACRDRSAGADYPWHEEYVGPRPDLRGRCVRCGERRLA
jgi:hypothetical protein